jgi:tetratricopeptide (TPR) repeat protein
MNDLKADAKAIFLEALDYEAPDDLIRLLDRECGVDAALRVRVEELLRAHQDAGNFLGRQDQPEVARDEPLGDGPGTVVGPYKLLEQIGEGGFGIVFMAEQQQPVRRKVALKMLKPGMDTRQVIARFEAERQALALMDDPHIATVFDAGQTRGGRPYFVMELVKGVPLTEYCDRSRLTTRERLALFITVCRAVQHAHHKGIIHRDLKPSNVLVTQHDGAPMAKLIDFGIAKALGQQLTDKTLFTGFSQLIGSPLYMSPEQAALSNVDVDTRSDIYSLGVLLYELLTGITPFDRERMSKADYDEVRRIIREEEPAKPSTRITTLGQATDTVCSRRGSDSKRLRRLVSGELDWIVMKALEKDRNRRYETASAFAADVQRALNDEPVHACPPSALYQLRKFSRRHRTVLSLAGLVLFFIVSLGVGIGWVVRDRGAREQEIAHDREVREATLDREVDRVLHESGPLIELGKWAEALAEVERADKLLELAGRADRPQRLLDLRQELTMANRLEEIYREPPRGVKSGAAVPGAQQPDRAEEEFFWGRNQDSRFVLAFRELGIDVDALEPGPAAERVSRTSIRQALVRALDDWAAMRKRAGRKDGVSWKKLVDIARQADSDEWRNQFREALLKGDRSPLEKLADAIPIHQVSPATAYLLGHSLRELGAVDKAMTVLREAHRHNPDDFWLNDALGWLSVDACRPPRYDDALRYYMATVVLRPRNATAHRAVAELLEKKGALEEALAEYSRVLELDPKDRRALRERAEAYLKAHQNEKALGDYSKAIELDPKDADAWINRGDTYSQLEQYEKALGDYSKAIELDPKDADALNNRGYAYRQLGQFEKAIADCSRAIELDPQQANPWNTRGLAYSDWNQAEKAFADFTKAIDLEPKFAIAWNNRGFALRQLGQFEKGIADCNKAIQLDPKNPGFWNNRAWGYRVLHQDGKALADYAKAIELGPKYVIAFNDRGLMYHDLGQYSKACSDWSRALELKPNSSIYQNQLAWLMATCPDADVLDPMQAVTLAAKAVKTAPNDGDFWNTLGVSQYRASYWKPAIASLTRSMELQGDRLGSFNTLFLAMAYWQIGEKEEASKWYTRAVQWMEKNRQYLDKNAEQRAELERFRAEAEELLSVKKK